jgi:hypothetical protein
MSQQQVLATRMTCRIGIVLLGLCAFCIKSPHAIAQSFGGLQIASNVKVATVFSGAGGPTFVQFTPAILTGCSGNNGGYLTTLWPAALGASVPDTQRHATQIAMLLTAKATDSLLEVRYRVNASGTGWDNCAIDAIWLLN